MEGAGPYSRGALWRFLGLAASVVGAITAFYPALSSYFLSDDFTVLDTLLSKGKYLVWQPSQALAFFRPIASVSILIDNYVWGLDAFGYHLTNLLLHGVNAFLLYIAGGAIIRTTGSERESSQFVPLAAAVVFLTLPNHCEPVCWISGRTDLLAAGFSMVSLWSFARHIDTARRVYLLLSASSYLCALLSKESAILLPFAFMALSLLSKRGAALTVRGLSVPSFFLHFAAVPVYAATRYMFLGTLLGGYGGGLYRNYSAARLFIDLLSFAGRCVMPANADTRPFGVPLLTLILLLFVLGLLITKSSHKRPLRLWCILAVAWLASVLPVLPVGLAETDSRNERLLYWPSALAVLFLFSVLRHRLSRLPFTIVTAALVAVFSLALNQVARDWCAAGNIARGIVVSLQTIPPASRLMIVGLPSHLRGAHVFTNGIGSAVRLFSTSGKFNYIVVVSYAQLGSPHGRVANSQSGDVYRFRADDEGVSLDWSPGQLISATWEQAFDIIEATSTGGALRLTRLRAGDQVVYYSDGQLIPLSAGPFNTAQAHR